MNVQETQRWIHRVNTTAAIVLLTTGVMHTLPDLRSLLIGGYDRLIADIHLWTGAVFISFPLLMIVLSRGSVLGNVRVRIFKDHVWHWRRINLTLTIIMCSSQACAGTLIYIDTIYPMPITVVDSLFVLHHAGAWYIGLMLPVHLWMARKAIIRTLRSWLGMDRIQSDQYD